MSAKPDPFKPEIREHIAQAVKRAMRLPQATKPPTRERERAAIAGMVSDLEWAVEGFVAWRRKWLKGGILNPPTTHASPNDWPIKGDIKPALNKIERALAMLAEGIEELPLNSATELDALVRLHGIGWLSFIARRDEWMERFENARDGGAIDAYLPETPETPGLATIVHRLKNATAVFGQGVESIGREGAATEQERYLVRRVIDSYRRQLDLEPRTSSEHARNPFQTLLAIAFDAAAARINRTLQESEHWKRPADATLRAHAEAIAREDSANPNENNNLHG